MTRTPNFRKALVLGIRGEPSTPEDPAVGKVWSAILDQVDQPGSTSEFVSVTDAPRETFHKHPWSIGGGGAAELKDTLDAAADGKLGDMAAAIGITAVTGEDDVYVLPDLSTARRLGVERTRPLVIGELVRDWHVAQTPVGLWIYGDEFRLLSPGDAPRSFRLLWAARAVINKRKRFGTPMVDRGLTWYEWQELYTDKLRTPLSIAFAFVATHNHFVLDRGGKVFNRSAPVIKLSPEATEDDHLALLGLLNSSTACFWMKQVFHNKGSTVDERGARQRTMPFEDFYEFTGTALQSFPVPNGDCFDVAASLDGSARRLVDQLPSEIGEFLSIADRQLRQRQTLEEMIARQEELDWRCYELYGLVGGDGSLLARDPPQVRLGERAFEMVMARGMAAGELDTAWFERHGSTPITETPAHWPESYRRVVERRIEEIESNPQIALIEQPEYKRRWNVEPWKEQVERALRHWLLDRLESSDYWQEVALTSVGRLADRARRDEEFMQVAALYRGQEAFDLSALVAVLVNGETVPFLPVLRYKPSGLRKREAWERTWDLQRREDAVDALVSLPEGDSHRISPEDAARIKQADLGTIPVPPKYATADFANSTYWRLRGKLDVPKERFISYPFCEREADPTMVIGWAGWDHLQQARALATYYVQMKESEGWTSERLTPLLAGLLELLPWLKQWHNEIDPEYGVGMGDYFEGFVEEETRALGVTVEDVRGWVPAAAMANRPRPAKRTTT